MIDLHIDFDEVLAFAADLAGVDEMVEVESRSAISAGLSALQQVTEQHTPVASGATRQGFGTVIKGTPVHVKGELVNPVPHAWFAEKGRRPGKMPPISAIELWVRRKAGVSASESRSVAFLIARAIGRRGTRPGAQMLEKGWNATEGIIIRNLEGIPERIIRRLSA